MNIEDIVIVCKESKYQYDRRMLGISHDDLISIYARECLNIPEILASHNAQIASANHLRHTFEGAKIVDHYDFNRELAEQAKAVIFLGGDDNFKAGTHHVLNETPIVGMTSDPERSEGALNYFTSMDAMFVRDNLLTDRFQTERWQRIHAEVVLPGQQPIILPPAVSEVYIGAAKPTKTARIVIFPPGGKDEELKGSGIVIATPVGTKGWYHSAKGILRYQTTDHVLTWVLREPYEGKHIKNQQQNGIINFTDEMILISTMNTKGMISADSVDADDVEFNRGAEAHIKISDKPLNVLVNPRLLIRPNSTTMTIKEGSTRRDRKE